MTNKEREAGVAKIFQNLGAGEKQARVMAAQMLKRAAQQAETQEISELEALERLLRAAVAGHQGVPPSFLSRESAQSRPEQPEKSCKPPEKG